MFRTGRQVAIRVKYRGPLARESTSMSSPPHGLPLLRDPERLDVIVEIELSTNILLGFVISTPSLQSNDYKFTTVVSIIIVLRTRKRARRPRRQRKGRVRLQRTSLHTSASPSNIASQRSAKHITTYSSRSGRRPGSHCLGIAELDTRTC